MSREEGWEEITRDRVGLGVESFTHRLHIPEGALYRTTIVTQSGEGNHVALVFVPRHPSAELFHGQR